LKGSSAMDKGKNLTNKSSLLGTPMKHRGRGGGKLREGKSQQEADKKQTKRGRKIDDEGFRWKKKKKKWIERNKMKVSTW